MPVRPIVRRLVIAALLATVIGLSFQPRGFLPAALPSRPPSGSSNADCTPCSEVQGMLDRRNRAVESQREDAYLEDLDSGNVALLAHERMVFENLRQIPLTTYRARAIDPASNQQYVKGNPLNQYPYDVTIFKVGVWAQVTGVDNAPYGSMFDYVLAQVSGRYRIVDIKDSSGGDSSLISGVPWTLTPLHVTRGPDVIIAADGSVGDAGSFMSAASLASQRIRAQWGKRPAPRAFMVYLTRDEKTMESWYADGDFAAAADGVAHYEIPVDGNLAPKRKATFTGAPVTVNVASTLLDNTPQVVLEHEFAHAISSLIIQPGAGPIPKWVLEGFAVWMSTLDAPQVQDSLRAYLRYGAAADFTGELPVDQTFYSGSPEEVGFHYALGFAVFALLAERWGVQKTVDIYAALTNGRSAGLPDGGLDQVLSDQGADPQEFRSSWKRYVLTGA